MNVSCNRNICEVTITIITSPCKQTIMKHDLNKFNLTQFECRIWNLINLHVNRKKLKVCLFFQLVSDNNDVNHVFGCFYLVSSKPEIWTVILHKWNKLELTCMNCSWVAELEQKQIFLPFYIPFKIFCLGLPAIHVYEIRFYLPTVLPCSRCDSHESMFSNLELAAAGSPSKLLHSTAQESQCHSISVPVWTAARYACLDIPING